VTSRELERIALARHDENMRRPIKELFPNPAPRAVAVCKFCGKVYERAVTAGKSRGYCGDRCRDAAANPTRGHQFRLRIRSPEVKP
jgi:hypothetical protein